MAATASHAHPVSTHSATPSVINTHANFANGHVDAPGSPASSGTGQPTMATMSKKAKGKKAADPNETSKLLAAKISQLEQDAAGEKDQEAEIGAYRPCVT